MLITYHAPANGKKFFYVFQDGKVYRAVSGKPKGKPLPECNLTKVLLKQATPSAPTSKEQG